MQFQLWLCFAHIQQKQVYDKRTKEEKVARGVKLTAGIAANALAGTSTTHLTEKDAVTPAKDDMVALVEEGSTRKEPMVLLGKVLRVYTKEREVLLAHLREMEEHGKYKLVVGTSTWVESFDALIFPIDIAYDAARNIYTLATSKVDIHKSVRLN